MNRSHDERSSSADTLPETAREETVNRSHDERSSSADTLPETAREETVNRSHDERSSSADTLPETARVETGIGRTTNGLHLQTRYLRRHARRQ